MSGPGGKPRSVRWNAEHGDRTEDRGMAFHTPAFRSDIRHPILPLAEERDARGDYLNSQVNRENFVAAGLLTVGYLSVPATVKVRTSLAPVVGIVRRAVTRMVVVVTT